MMTDATALRELLAKVEAGEDPDMDLLGHALGAQMMRGHHAFFGSLDAAKTLHEAVLPEYFWDLSSVNTCQIQRIEDYPCGTKYRGDCDCPARAWLIAILKAKIQEADNG